MASELVDGVLRRVPRTRPGGADRRDSPAAPVARTPAVRLDHGGIGDTLCALAAATGAGLPFVPPANRREWAELFAETPDVRHPSIDLRLSDYRPDLDQNVAPRWEFWAAQTGGHKLPQPRPLPAEALDAAIPYAGRVVLAPFAAHGPGHGAYSRSWPAERWAETNRLLIEAGHQTVILDGDEDRCHRFQSCHPVANEPGARIGDRTAILCGASPATVAAVLTYATAFAGNDSGMAHLAGTLGVPGVAVCSVCSDVRIFGCYPSITSLGGRGVDFHAIEPEQVAIAVRARALTTLGDFPLADFAKIVLPQEQWRLSGWLGVYRVLWDVARRLQPRRIVEIGTRAGYSAWTFLRALPEATVHGIDANLDEHGGFVGAMNHARDILPADRFGLTVADSHTLTELPPAELVFVDGDHSHDGCLADLRLALTARPKWILVDDVANCWDQVKPACDRFASELGLKPEFIPSPTGLYLIDVRPA